MSLVEETNKLAIVIPARLESTRIYHKPLITINDSMLVEYAIRAAKACVYKPTIILTSESDEVFSSLSCQRDVSFFVTSRYPLTGTERAAELLGHTDHDVYLLLPCDIFPISGKLLDSMFDIYLKKKHPFMCLATKLRPDEFDSYDDVKIIVDDDHFAMNFIREIPANILNNLDFHPVMLKQLGVYIYSRAVLTRFAESTQDIFEIVYSNESYRFLHKKEKMKIILTDNELYSINTPADILKLSQRGYDVQYTKGKGN
ncbi:cytidylyltransferase domain-containing protein [Martelella alba]|nr:hypothetical protein [Martelella alba]